MNDLAYVEAVVSWRQEREEKLSSPHGWLATAGLFWLQPGENRMGVGRGNFVRLPAGSAPSHAATFTLEADVVKIKAAPGVKILSDSQPIETIEIAFEEETSPAFSLNDLKIYIIRRGKRIGVRIFDPNNPARKQFTGLNWFPVDPAYCLQARYYPMHESQTIPIINILGDIEQMPFPGIVEFDLRGECYRLEPVSLEDGRLWFMFRDLSNGTQTYPAGRYLIGEVPLAGMLLLDFNRSYNPPCAYTEFATCPLPPANNRLPIEILAGEQKYALPYSSDQT